MRYRPHQTYAEAIDRASLMLLAALRDHIQPQFSSVQLEILRRRKIANDYVRGYGEQALEVVFADIRNRSTSMLVAELRRARVADDVASEVTLALDRLLITARELFTQQLASGRDIVQPAKGPSSHS
jgi:hypothetical protein